MNWVQRYAFTLVLMATIVVGARPCAAADWKGVDETVVEKFAAEAGRPAHEPWINTDQGDLLLFLFLIAGAAGGFVAGYAFRGLFPPKVKKDGDAPHS